MLLKKKETPPGGTPNWTFGDYSIKEADSFRPNEEAHHIVSFLGETPLRSRGSIPVHGPWWFGEAVLLRRMPGGNM